VGIENRPYVGSWKLNQKKVVQYTPDCLVYVNGDLTIPGDLAQGKRRRVNIQPYITAVSVDAGTDPGGASANISLSIPVHSADPFIRDAQFILRPGLEIHVYMRGYFPVRGLFRYVSDYVDQESGIYNETAQKAKVVSDDAAGDEELAEMADKAVNPSFDNTTAASMEEGKEARDGDYKDLSGYIEDNDQFDEYINQAAMDYNVPPDIVKATMAIESNFKYCPPNSVGATGLMQLKAGTAKDRAREAGYNPDEVDEAFLLQNNEANIRMGTAHLHWLVVNYYTDEATGETDWYKVLAAYNQGHGPVNQAYGPGGSGMTAKAHHYPLSVLSTVEKNRDDSAQELIDAIDSDLIPPQTRPPVVHRKKPSDDLMAYPYYHVFHGVVTQADHAYSGGFQTASLNCGSMLYFWSYHAMSTSASHFGARAPGSKNRTTFIGHNFTGWHPYEIIYKLYRDVGGAAQGVGWALSQKTNQAAKIGNNEHAEALFSLNLKYWQQRFNTTMMKLRMHGATGHLFNASQAAFLGRLSTSAVNALFKKRYPKGDQKDDAYRIFSTAMTLGLVKPKKKKAIEKAGIDIAGFGAQSHEGANEINLFEMIAFVKDIGQMGEVNLFESTYETKMDIAQKVCEITGFEFYQDVDGDLVFKPPFYNLDTSTSRIYRIEDIDIVSLNFSEKEPEVTYMTVKGPHFKNMLGTGMENEWGVQGQYIDFRLVAQFGWRGQSFETSYFNSARAMFYAAVNRLDVLNAGTNYASLTIPLRPELRPGYPVYIPYLDAFYYCNSFSHSFQYGGQCTTSLQLLAKRAKFYAPGKMQGNGIDDIHLDKAYMAPRPLGIIDTKGGVKKKLLKGFPNVVMALDPNEINPLYSLAPDGGVADLSKPEVLKNLLELAANEGNIITRVYDEYNEHTGAYTYKKDRSDDVVTILVGQDPPDASSQTINLSKVADAFSQLSAKTTEAITTATGKLNSLLAELNKLEADYENYLNSDDTAVQAKAKEVAAKIAKKKTEVANAEANKASLAEKAGVDQDAIEYIEILKAITGLVGIELKGQNPDFDDFENSRTLLDLLRDKKCVFSDKSAPGTYRYYSCAHPTPNQQGDEDLQGGPQVGLGFLPDITSIEDPKPEALYKYGVSVKKGLAVETGGTRTILPTSEIQNIAFGYFDVKAEGKKSTRTKKKTRLPPIMVAIRDVAIREFKLIVVKKASESDVLNDILEIAWNIMPESITENQTDVTPGPYPDLTDENFLGTIEEILARPAIREQGIKNKMILTNSISEAMGRKFAQRLMKSYEERKAFAEAEGDKVFESTKDPNKKWKKVKTLMYDANTAMEAFTGLSMTKGGLDSKEAATVKTIESPIFPVSDAQGYQVIGSYRYGRGVGVSKDNVLNQLMNADPMAAIDQTVLEQYLDNLHKSGKEQGSQDYKDYQIAKAALVSSLEETYSEQELLDIGILRVDGDELRYRPENFFADQRDAVQKLSAGNAAYSLADLNFHQSRLDVSDLRPMEAGVLMEAMSTDFATILESQDIGVIETFTEIDGVEELSEIDRAQALAIARKRADWEDFQRNIRGRPTENPRQSTLEAINESIKTMKTGSLVTSAQAESIAQSASTLGEE